MKTITIDNVEYELEQHDDNNRLSEIKIPKGWRLLKPYEAQRLWDLGYLRSNWFFVENPLKNGRVAGFYANLGWANLDCFGDPSDTNASLGVVLARDLKVKEEMKIKHNCEKCEAESEWFKAMSEEWKARSEWYAKECRCKK